MKIKKIFGLFSVCSLAVLMTACGKSSKNDGILDVDYYNVKAITKEEYIDENKADKEVNVVFAAQKISDSYSSMSNGIVTTYDDDNYYIYNLKLGGLKIAEFKKDDIYSISCATTYSTAYIKIRFKTDDAGKTRWVVYLVNGRCIHDSSDDYSNEPRIARAESEKEIMINIMGDTIKYQKMALQAYTGSEDDKKLTTTYYYAIKEKKDSGYETYLTEEEFNEKYQEYKDWKYDGAAIGLKGYTLQVLNDMINIYNKKGEIVNIYAFGAEGIISDGYMLYQTIKQVGVNGKYDIYYNGEYLQVNTFRVNMLTSKVEKVDGFHYLLKLTTLSPLITKDEEGNSEELKGFFCKVYDFKEKKSVTDNDLKLALVKGNGNIEVNKSLLPSTTGEVIDDGNNYYTYTSTTTTGTVVNDKKGKVVGVYDGTYYDGILVKTDNDANTTFYDKTGKKVLYLKNAVCYSLNKYVGTDLFGNTLVACIDNGEVKTADLKGYKIASNGFVTKTSEDALVTFYSFDNTLSPISIQYYATDCEFSDEYEYNEYEFNGYKYYFIRFTADDSYSIVYFK